MEVAEKLVDCGFFETSFRLTKGGDTNEGVDGTTKNATEKGGAFLATDDEKEKDDERHDSNGKTEAE